MTHKEPHNFRCRALCVGLPGFEPGQTEPKPVVLPLHHSPIIRAFLEKRCKGNAFISYFQIIFDIFFDFSIFYSIFEQ